MASTVAAGDVSTDAIVRFVKKDSNAIAKGDICNYTSSGWSTCGTSENGPYGVATAAAGASDTVVEMCLWGFVWATADGTVNPGQEITISASTAAQFIAYTATSINSTVTSNDVIAARDEYRASLGIYMNEVDQGDGEGGTVPTAISDGEVGLIFLGKVN